MSRNSSREAVELVDRATASTVDQSSLGVSVEEIRMGSVDGSVREYEFPRTAGDVSDLVERGDRIEIPPGRLQKVFRVSETRSFGLPTWTVIYVDEDVDLTSARRQQYHWKNELIAREGAVYASFGEDPLATPSFDVIGQTDHQADFSEFDGDASA